MANLVDEGSDVSLRAQIATLSADLIKTKKEVKDMRRLYASIDGRLRHADWTAYTEALAIASKEVENWRETIEKDRSDLVACLTQEVHEAILQKSDGLDASPRQLSLEIRRVELMCRELSDRWDARLGSEVGVALDLCSVTNQANVVTERMDAYQQDIKYLGQ